MSSKNAVKERNARREIESQTEEHLVSPVWHPSHEEIRRRAFEIHIERGGIHGCDLDDWMQAEKELNREGALIKKSPRL
jgi:Protein of unknown function (DUF2934)